ncbi:MAG: glyoxalase [Bacilli bacterium]|nr:glyoxalase [Bacilli bacterium]
MVPERVSLITFGARDLPLLRAFYQKLGWRETEISSDSYCVFKTAGVLLSLFPYEELVKDIGIEAPSNPAKVFRGVTYAINLDRREDVDKTIESIRESGALILREPSDAFWGGRTSYFADPEYNIWEVAWNPSAEFDERGAMVNF